MNHHPAALMRKYYAISSNTDVSCCIFFTALFIRREKKKTRNKLKHTRTTGTTYIQYLYRLFWSAMAQLSEFVSGICFLRCLLREKLVQSLIFIHVYLIFDSIRHKKFILFLYNIILISKLAISVHVSVFQQELHSYSSLIILSSPVRTSRNNL